MAIDLTTLPDFVLAQRIAAGCDDSFREIVRRYEGMVYALALRIVRKHQDAEEIVQDTFLSVARRINTFQGRAKLTSWLYRITLNWTYMKIRKTKQEHAILMDDLVSREFNDVQETRLINMSNNSEENAINGELSAGLEAAIGKLPEEYKAVFMLRDVDGLSNTEVGRILGISPAAVKSRLHRSRLMLRKRLVRHHGEPIHQPDKYRKVA